VESYPQAFWVDYQWIFQLEVTKCDFKLGWY